MKDCKRKYQMITCLLPAMAVLVCTCISLSGYIKPTFQAEAAEEDGKNELIKEETISENTEESSQIKIKVNKNKTVELPPVSEQTEDSGTVKTVKKTVDADAYRNGVYYGNGTGYGGKIRVRVTIKKEKICKIKIVESQDGKTYLQKASSLFNQIIKNQSTNVDVVSGATYSSNGLIEAVRDALKKAEKNKKQNSDNKSNEETTSQVRTSEVSTSENNTTDNNKTSSGVFPYKDDVYYGTGEGYRDDITVAVCICDKSIQYILITKASDDSAYLAKAKSILDIVIKNQSTDVDVVSGATFSSKGIIEAIKNALDEAKKVADGNVDLPQRTTEPASAPSSDSGVMPTPTVIPDASPGVDIPNLLVYVNGEYQSDVICNPDEYADFDAYTLSLKITVENDRITSVTEVKGSGSLYDSGNDWYIGRAVDGTKKYPGVVGQIISKGTYEGVDVVSGATCSSNAIIEAVKKALESAKK